MVFTDTPSLFMHALREHSSEATDWEISMAAQRDEAPPHSKYSGLYKDHSILIG